MTAMNVKSTDNKRVLMNERGNMMLPILGIFLVIGIMLQSSELVRIAQSNSITSNARIRDSRNALTLFLSRYSALPAAFRNSVVMSENSDLQACVLGSSSGLCYADGRDYPMNLYAASVDGAPAKKLAGSIASASPVLYNNKGQLCETGASSATVACPFEVTSSFKATCAGGATSCAKAESIFIQYKIHTPENLYSDASVKNRLVLATVENTAASVKVKDILPPSYDYVPNAVTNVSYVVNTVTTPGTTTTTAGTLSYEEIYAIVLAAIGGSNPTLVAQITNAMLTQYKIYNADLITSLAQIWVQSAAIAKRYADAISYRIYNWPNYAIPTPAQMTEMAKVPLALYPTNPTLAVAIASGVYPDSVLNQKMVDALVGITDYQVMQYIVGAQITSPTLAQAINTAVQSSGMYGNPAYILAEEAKYKNITDATLLTTIAKVIVSSGATGTVERTIIQQGITDLNVAKQMVAAAGGTTTTTTASTSTTTPTTTTTSSTSTSQTTTTTTTTASTVPVTMTAACTSTLDCGTTIGM